MSLFKILRGDSSRIGTNTTPFHDGYAYFTPDDSGFYIDAEVNGAQSRIRINPGSTGLELVLAANNWINGKQTVQVDGITANSNGFIGLSQDITVSQMEAAKEAGLAIDAQVDGAITIAAKTNTPVVDIPVQIILFP